MFDSLLAAFIMLALLTFILGVYGVKYGFP